MKRVLFVCHGNICRSPTAEFVMKNEVQKTGFSCEVESAACRSDAVGEDMYDEAKRILRGKGVPFERHTARLIRKSDLDKFDFILAMDNENMRDLAAFFGSENVGAGKKIRLLSSFAALPSEIDDPWYTRDFEAAYRSISRAVKILLCVLMTEAREACESDIESVMKIENEGFIEGIREEKDVFLERIRTFPEGFLIFKDREGEDVAYMASELWENFDDSSFRVGHRIQSVSEKAGILYLSSFALIKKYRGQGVGRALFGASLNHFVNAFNPECVFLLVNEEWTTARKIYEDFGFVPYKEISDAFEDEHGKMRTGIVMKNDLRAFKTSF